MVSRTLVWVYLGKTNLEEFNPEIYLSIKGRTKNTDLDFYTLNHCGKCNTTIVNVFYRNKSLDYFNQYISPLL